MFEAQAYGYKGIDNKDRQDRMRIIITNDTNSSSPRGNLHVQTGPHYRCELTFTLRRQPYTERLDV
jgi:hypothetical protein